MNRKLLLQLLAIAVVVGAATFVISLIGIPWLPEAAAEEAKGIDDIYLFTSIISIVIFAIVAAVSIYAVMKFRARPGDEGDGKHIHGHTGIEILWTVIPTVLVTAIAVWSGIVLVKNEQLPADYKIVHVIGQQFAWSFTYPEITGPDGGPKQVGELVLPVDQTVELQMNAPDVLHAFWVPEWRVKQDLVPGITTTYRITPNRVGVYDIICTELCGIGHSLMRSQARVVTREEFDAWVAEQNRPPEPPAGGDDGASIFAANGCGTCHTLAAAGTRGTIGPDLDTVLAGQAPDRIRESIVDPAAALTPEYQDLMPKDYGDKLEPAQLDTLVQYLVDSTGGAG